MNVSVVTLVWNNWRVAKNGILSMRRLLDREDVCELLVLDNGSTDETREAVQCVLGWPKTRLFRSDENLGCGGGRQLLFSAANGDRILSLDSDAIIVDASIIDLLEASLQTPGVGIVGDWGGNMRKPLRRTFQMMPRHYIGSVDAVSGYCHYFRTAVLNQGISVDPQFFKGGPDDSDFCLSIKYILNQSSFMRPVPLLHTWSGTSEGTHAIWTNFIAKWRWISMTPLRARSSAFHRAYAEKRWGIGSGKGSDTALNAPYRRTVEQELRRLGATTVLDAGCGDGRALQGCDFGGARYLGVDIVEHILPVAKSRLPYGEFQSLNLTDTPVQQWPDADIVLLKDVLQHWPNAHVWRICQQLPRKYKLALITNCTTPIPGYPPVNSDIEFGDFRPLDLSASPFSLPVEPILNYAETKTTFRLALDHSGSQP